MLCIGVVRLVEQDCVRVMVDSDGHRPSCGKLNPRRRPATPGEIVHNDIIKNIYLAHTHSIIICPSSCLQAVFFRSSSIRCFLYALYFSRYA